MASPLSCTSCPHLLQKHGSLGLVVGLTVLVSPFSYRLKKTDCLHRVMVGMGRQWIMQTSSGSGSFSSEESLFSWCLDLVLFFFFACPRLSASARDIVYSSFLIAHFL